MHETTYPPLEVLNSTAELTNPAAFYLKRKPGTLRKWAANPETSPIRPIRINGRLHWPTSAIRELLGVSA